MVIVVRTIAGSLSLTEPQPITQLVNDIADLLPVPYIYPADISIRINGYTAYMVSAGEASITISGQISSRATTTVIHVQRPICVKGISELISRRLQSVRQYTDVMLGGNHDRR